MKYIKLIGLISLICFSFFVTDKIIDVSSMQDEIMIKIKEEASLFSKSPKDAIINGDYIIPGVSGRNVDINKSYNEMKKIGYFDKSLFKYEKILPNISIYNNYDKYIIHGNDLTKNVSLIYIINNKNSLNNFLSVFKTKEKINFFIDSNILSNSLNIIDEIGRNNIYNYGNNGKYTRDNLLITNNIINNKANNLSSFCLFLEVNDASLKNCANSKMLSVMPNIIGYTNLKKKLINGSIILLDNIKETNNIIDFVNSKGFSIVTLDELINE